MDRKFKQRDVDVTIKESKNRVELELNGEPIEVAKIEGSYHSQLAHQFKSFDTIDELVDTLLQNEGRYWKLAPGGHGPHAAHGGAAAKPKKPTARKPKAGGRRTGGGRKPRGGGRKPRGGGRGGHGGHR